MPNRGFNHSSLSLQVYKKPNPFSAKSNAQLYIVRQNRAWSHRSRGSCGTGRRSNRVAWAEYSNFRTANLVDGPAERANPVGSSTYHRERCNFKITGLLSKHYRSRSSVCQPSDGESVYVELLEEHGEGLHLSSG